MQFIDLRQFKTISIFLNICNLISCSYYVYENARIAKTLEKKRTRWKDLLEILLWNFYKAIIKTQWSWCRDWPIKQNLGHRNRFTNIYTSNIWPRFEEKTKFTINGTGTNKYSYGENVTWPLTLHDNQLQA